MTQPTIDQAMRHVQSGQVGPAEAICRHILSQNPNSIDALNLLGAMLNQSGRSAEAAGLFERAVAISPQNAVIRSNLASALMMLGRQDEAMAAYRQAIAINPNLGPTWFNLGLLLRLKSEVEEAESAFRRARVLSPGDAEIAVNLAAVLLDLGRVQEAVAEYESAVALRPEYALAQSNLLYTLYFHPDFDAAAIYRRHARWNEQVARQLSANLAPHGNDRSPDRRLRIGYVSPDFRRHAESFFTVPLFANHDRRQFEIHFYSHAPMNDDITERIRGYGDGWRDTSNTVDSKLAEQIREDQIDILVDLTMHMGNGRTLLFARKPAPVQVAWLAYPGTTGLEAMDYRFTDRWMDPAESPQKMYSEQSVHLPDCWVCYDPLGDWPASPVRQAGPIRFGSLNSARKLNEQTIDLWCGILRAAPDSRLILLAHTNHHRRLILDWATRRGINAARLEFVDRLPRDQYMKMYDRIDIGLDPMPYNGITTTCDALWAGVPVLTLPGHTAAGRAGQGILMTAGLPELVARSPQDLARVAAELAADAPRLAQYRQTLRDRMRQSPLMDAPRFARNVERAYRTMWHRWCEAGV